MKEGLWQTLSRKKVAFLAVILAAGIIFLALSEYISTGTTESKPAFSEDAYTKDLETRLEALLERMDGVSEVKVMITLSGSESYQYAKETVKSVMAGGESTETVLPYRKGSGGQSEPILTAVAAPEIKGVSVVCRGAGNDAVRRRTSPASRPP